MSSVRPYRYSSSSLSQLDPELSLNDSYPVPCIKAYRLTGEEEVVLPPECPSTLPPLRRCTCPDADAAKAAVGLRSSLDAPDTGSARPVC